MKKINPNDELAEVLSMNPHLTLDEVNTLLAHRLEQQNDKAIDDFFGLSPNQVQNWLYAPFSDLKGVQLQVPPSFAHCPIMRYLDLMIQSAQQSNGAIKLTAHGNLPASLVRQANELLPTISVADQSMPAGINEFAGSKEEKFMALHYTRILAELSGVFFKGAGRLQIRKADLKSYETGGMATLFLPMLEAATRKFNWGYFDGYDEVADLRLFWLFMLWRIRSHASVQQLASEMGLAFPALRQQIFSTQYSSADDVFLQMIHCRFVERFLNFWGFVAFDFSNDEKSRQRQVRKQPIIQPLMREVFLFEV